MKQKVVEFEANMGYTGKPCIKNQKRGCGEGRKRHPLCTGLGRTLTPGAWGIQQISGCAGSLCPRPLEASGPGTKEEELWWVNKPGGWSLGWNPQLAGLLNVFPLRDEGWTSFQKWNRLSQKPVKEVIHFHMASPLCWERAGPELFV